MYFDNREHCLKLCMSQYNSSLYLIVKEKYIKIRDHGERIIVCEDFYSNQTIKFYPSSYLINGIILYDRIAIGDTLSKNSNSYEINIHSKGYNETYIFSCDDLKY